MPSAALKVSPSIGRRQAVIAGATLVPAVVMPQRAHADAIDDIAAKNAVAAAKSRAEKEKAKEMDGVNGILGQGLNTILSVGALGLVGFAGVFFTGIKKDVDASTLNNLDRNRFLSDQERRAAAKLSDSEKKARGIKF